MDTKAAIPHQKLLDALQVAMLPIIHQLPVVTSMLKWAKAATDGKTITGPMGWMMIVDPEWTNQDQTDHFINLKRSVSEIKKPLVQIISHIHEFSSIKSIEKALIAFQQSYKELPIIDPELALLKLGHNLFENKDLIPNLLDYVEKLSKLQEKGSNLKQIVVREVINRLSIPAREEKPFRFSELEERIDESS